MNKHYVFSMISKKFLNIKDSVITIIIFGLILFPKENYGQNRLTKLEDGTPIVWVNHWVSTHFISPNPIEYIDLSTDDVLGDIPNKKIARIRPIEAFHSTERDMGYITIIGEGFFQQYRLLYTDDPDLATKKVPLHHSLNPTLRLSQVSLSPSEAIELAKKIWHHKPGFYAVGTKKNRLEIRLNNLYVFGGYLFVDFQIQNKTEIPFTIQQIDYSIDDISKAKATNQQSMPVNPYVELLNNSVFKKFYRNIVIFHQFTLLDSKVLSIRVVEEGLMGRTIKLVIKHRDILNADVP